jgi:hypothetical protein
MFFPPGDRKYQGLWRTGGLAFYAGSLQGWWDLLKLLQQWHFAVAGVALVLVFSGCDRT